MGEGEETVTLPADAAWALWRLFDVLWNRVGFLDPGRELVSDGVRLTQIGALVDTEDTVAIELALDTVAEYYSEIRDALQPTSDPATCRHCGGTSHGAPC